MGPPIRWLRAPGNSESAPHLSSSFKCGLDCLLLSPLSRLGYTYLSISLRITAAIIILLVKTNCSTIMNGYLPQTKFTFAGSQPRLLYKLSGIVGAPTRSDYDRPLSGEAFSSVSLTGEKRIKGSLGSSIHPDQQVSQNL